MQPSRPAPTAAPPDDFTHLVNAWRESRIVLTAVELDLFSAIGDGATAAEVAARLAADPRGTGILLNALAALGLLEKRGDSFRNGQVAARFLCAGSPDDRRGALMHNAALWQRWSALTECVRTGRPASRAPRDEADTSAFIAAMHANSTQRAPALIAALDLSGVRRALDVGGLARDPERLQSLSARTLRNGAGHIGDGLRRLADRDRRDDLVGERVDRHEAIFVLEPDIDP
jgi:hypothetical protein